MSLSILALSGKGRAVEVGPFELGPRCSRTRVARDRGVSTPVTSGGFMRAEAT